MTYIQWLREISTRYPVIDYFDIEDWEYIARLNGYLPLPFYV